MATNEKEKIIATFLEAIKKDGRVLKYINEENIRTILEEQISSVVYTNTYKDELLSEKGCTAVYYSGNREIICRPEYKGDLTVIIHEMFHALTTNVNSFLISGEKSIVCKSGLKFFYGGKGWYNKYEIGRGLNEGITQYLTRHIVGAEKNNLLRALGMNIENNLLRALGMNIVNDNVYPIEQQIVEELVAVYGEGAVLGSYFEISPERLIQAMGESGAIKNPQSVLTKIMSKLDVHGIFERLLIKNDGKAYKKEFMKIQEIIIKDLVEKEINFALKSKEPKDLTRVKQILNNLQGLDVSIDGKNVFESAIESFNSRVQKVPNGEEFVVGLSKKEVNKFQDNLSHSTQENNSPSNFYDFFEKRNEQALVSSSMNPKSAIKLTISVVKAITKGFLKVIKKIQKTRLMIRDKDALALISAPRDDAEVNQSPQEDKQENAEEQKRETLLEKIRGYNEDEYEKFCQKLEQEWLNQRREDKNTRDNQMDRG